MASNNIVNNYCSTLIQIATDVVKKYESNVEIIKKTEDELNDVYHEIELGKPQDLYGGYKLYKQVKDLRMQRRQAKDENDLLKDMYEYVKVSLDSLSRVRFSLFRAALQRFMRHRIVELIILDREVI